ncbi:MAG: Asp-tRNA(Asn)/Glu-tRNA(Gln) amidotransferase subunit GatA [Gemmatimonadota bacterium]|nr:Asp-tRNA(Asn)/Glu-tRNA(Gln) amidotransferase subunit GatA [Gemmatimonadota bacterium]
MKAPPARASAAAAKLLAGPLTECVACIREGAAIPADMVSASFDRADEVGAGKDALNIFISTDRERATESAKQLTAHLGRAEALGNLAGVPVALKDNIATLGMPTTCGSRILEGYVSPYEATVVRRLRANGAVIVGKTNMDEFAMGSSTENSAYGPTRNPVDIRRVPGGSSGGSAAAVAAGIVRLALGSETGGSVRQPASFCGVVGVKPTYGRVSRYGLVAFGSSLDQVGVLGRTVEDAAIGMEVISGCDPLDSTSADVPVPRYELEKNAGLKGLVIGKPREYFPDGLDPRIAQECERALDAYRELGATVRDVSLPHTSYSIPVYYIIAPAEASSNLARFDGVRYGLRVLSERGLNGMYEETRARGFGPEVTRRVLLGTYVLSAGYYDAYYKKAQAVRTLIAQDFRDVFASGVDVLFTPTTPTPAFELGAVKDAYEMYLSDIFTASANLAGVPAMSVPISDAARLPIGGQIIAPHFGESVMFRAAFGLERALAGNFVPGEQDA